MAAEITPANKYGALSVGQACAKCFANMISLIEILISLGIAPGSLYTLRKQ